MRYSDIQAFLERAFYHFNKKGYLNLYSLIFRFSQFPLFSVVQMIWSSYIIQQSYSKKKKTIVTHICKLLLAFTMIFGPREVAALTIKFDSPLMNNLIQFPIFLVIYALINYSPKDIFPKIISYFTIPLGTIEGINYIRFFGLLWRKITKLNPFIKINICSTLALSDMIIEIISRLFLDGEETKHSNILIVFLSVVCFILFFIANSILKLPMHYPFLICTLLLSAIHITPSFIKNEKKEKKEKKE